MLIYLIRIEDKSMAEINATGIKICLKY